MAKKGFVIDNWVELVAKSTAILASNLTSNGQIAYNSTLDKAIVRSNGVNDPVVLEARAATLTNKTLTSPVIDTAIINDPTVTDGQFTDSELITPIIDTPTVNDGTFADPAITGGTITGTAISQATITASTIALNDTASTFDLNLTSTSNPPLTGNRSLVFDTNNGSRTLDIAGDLTLANDLTTSGDFELELTTTAATNVTLPTTGTLSTLAGTETLTNKTLTAPAINSANIDGQTASNTSRITIPKADKSTLDALTRKEATIVYADDQNTLYLDDGATLSPIGGNFVSYASENITNGGTITISLVVGLQLRRVQGDGAAVTANALAFGGTAPSDGTVVRLIGQSNTNTVRLQYQAGSKRLALNGDCILGQGSVLTMQYDATLDVWLEVSRENCF